MLHRPKKQRRPFVADNPLLRDRYCEELAAAMSPGLPIAADADIEADVERIPIGNHYAQWLREKGVDPDTGRMTVEGLNFFQELLEADRHRKQHP